MILPQRNNKPLNQHSLISLEDWLFNIGACKNEKDPSTWILSLEDWSAEIIMGQDELKVIWLQGDRSFQRSFPYSFMREDVERAIIQGP
tara:strand:+ start:4700 stop:4966 length:267 start_codon:yes stop_codon:yes gene_type:complete